MTARSGSPGHVAVVGAGAFGAWTVWHLLRGGARVTLIDAWGPGNSRSSSGGETRVIRAVYGADRRYTEMVAAAYPQWLELEARASTTLHTPAGALWMLRDAGEAYLRAAGPVCAEFGFPVESIGVAKAARRWPQIDFAGIREVFFEPRAGVLHARRSCRILCARFLAEGGEYRTARVKPGFVADGVMGALRVDGGEMLRADAYVFACGPWLGGIFPDLVGDALRPTRQEVFFFGPPAGDEAFGARALPAWVDFGERIVYGVPDIDGRGLKVADDTRGERVDPERLERAVGEAGLARARAFVARRFPRLSNAPLLESRVCQYENSPDGDLVVDRHPEAGNAWLAGGGSGHGFKLAPAVGGLVAGAVLSGSPTPAAFGLGRLKGSSAHSTQFDTG